MKTRQAGRGLACAVVNCGDRDSAVIVVLSRVYECLVNLSQTRIPSIVTYKSGQYCDRLVSL
jgi:hypothetical protein